MAGVETNGTETKRGEQDSAQSFQETGPVVSTQLTEKQGKIQGDGRKFLDRHKYHHSH